MLTPVSSPKPSHNADDLRICARLEDDTAAQKPRAKQSLTTKGTALPYTRASLSNVADAPSIQKLDSDAVHQAAVSRIACTSDAPEKHAPSLCCPGGPEGDSTEIHGGFREGKVDDEPTAEADGETH